jgi:hypothetical protein
MLGLGIEKVFVQVESMRWGFCAGRGCCAKPPRGEETKVLRDKISFFALASESLYTERNG